MTTDFQTALSKIKSQQLHLANLNERAVELGVILPLLKRVGWDTEDLTQIYPQETPGNGRDAVDYALKIGGKSRVFIEAKKWGANLDDHVAQLRDYCNASPVKEKPELAVLTNGRQWRLYLRPLSSRNKKHTPELRRFIDFDITNYDPRKVEECFRQFLARTSISSIKKTVGAAKVLRVKYINDVNVMGKLNKVWNKLVAHPDEWAEVLSFLAQQHKIQADEEHLKNFLESNICLFNPVTVTPKKTYSRPISFTFRANGIEEIIQVTKWASLKLKLCGLMYERHPDTFSDQVLAVSKNWFSASSDNGNEYSPVGDSGISVYMKGASAQHTKDLCSNIVAKFGYHKDALTIHHT